jgi:hypothetical protein
MSVHQFHQTYTEGLKSTYRLKHSSNGKFNTPYHQHTGNPNKKINKEILELNDAIDQMDLTDVCRIFHLTIAQYTFFSATHGTLSKIDHILGHKASVNKYKKK